VVAAVRLQAVVDQAAAGIAEKRENDVLLQKMNI